jgi:toxin ParE1/3/4
MKLNITASAKRDIEDIFTDGLGKQGESQARSYIQNIYAKLHMLLDFPYLGHMRADIPDTHRAIRAEKDHIAVYRIDNDIIHIVRILYCGFDFTQQKIQ